VPPVEVNGVRLLVEESGRGDPLVSSTGVGTTGRFGRSSRRISRGVSA
jgi:hypothetical protein